MTRTSILLMAFLIWLAPCGTAQIIGDKSPEDASNKADESAEYEHTTMEEMVVTEVRSAIENAFTFNDFHQVNDRGEYYYRIGRYKEAFPYLLASAKRGFKVAQAQVGYIYLTGQGAIKPSKATALAWLGVAASPKSDPEIKNYYKDLLKTIPEHLKPKIEQVVQAFIDKYGTKATGMSCDHVRRAGTHVSDLKCNFEGEFENRDALFQDWLSTGFDQAVTPFATGPGAGADSLSAPSTGGAPAAGS
ncbi:MAG: hypothetical protein OXG08_05280 [Gammaproteobacteria bacterium]|nr:hypothetical protein [Gammaproteobacteria bacterium]